MVKINVSVQTQNFPLSTVESLGLNIPSHYKQLRKLNKTYKTFVFRHWTSRSTWGELSVWMFFLDLKQSKWSRGIEETEIGSMGDGGDLNFQDELWDRRELGRERIPEIYIGHFESLPQFSSVHEHDVTLTFVTKNQNQINQNQE